MTQKQKNVLDYMIRWAEKEIKNGDRTPGNLAEDGIEGMSNPGDAMFYALQTAGYSYAYVNDAAYGGERGGYMYKVLDAIEQPFKDHFMEKYENNK